MRTTVLIFETTTQYRRDIKRLKKQGCDLTLLDDVLNALLEEKPLAVQETG
jgi:mRNA-degrading endonuclease YafQ of YafQ-DinJ toxin-antitoxin module